MSNSKLINFTVRSPNHYGERKNKISRITPHCVVGQLNALTIGELFTDEGVKASCNYGIGTDGQIVLCVDENNASWCSSNSDNDNKAVTIECACDLTSPYAMNNIVYNKLIDLCVDICKRNGITKVLSFDTKEEALSYTPRNNECVLTAHRWFANKECPGDWLYSRYNELAHTVNNKLLETNTCAIIIKDAFKTEGGYQIVSSKDKKILLTVVKMLNEYGITCELKEM